MKKMKKREKKINIKKRFLELAESLNLEDSGEEYSTFEKENGEVVKLDRNNIMEIVRNLFNKNESLELSSVVFTASISNAYISSLKSTSSFIRKIVNSSDLVGEKIEETIMILSAETFTKEFKKLRS